MTATFYGNEEGTAVTQGEIPEEHQAQAEEYREKLIEAVASVDEDLMEKYFEGEEISIEELKAAIRKATIAVEFYPVVCGTAFKHKGVRPMLDAVVDYLTISNLMYLQSKVLTLMETKKLYVILMIQSHSLL